MSVSRRMVSVSVRAPCLYQELNVAISGLVDEFGSLVPWADKFVEIQRACEKAGNMISTALQSTGIVQNLDEQDNVPRLVGDGGAALASALFGGGFIRGKVLKDARNLGCTFTCRVNSTRDRAMFHFGSNASSSSATFWRSTQRLGGVGLATIFLAGTRRAALEVCEDILGPLNSRHAKQRWLSPGGGLLRTDATSSRDDGRCL